MADAMVVARMSQEKKDAVARKLAEMGTNASCVINQLYDYIEATGALPFSADDGSLPPRKDRAVAARSWMVQLGRLPEGNRFQNASDEEIRAARLAARSKR